MKKHYLLWVLSMACFLSYGQIPAGYYNQANGLNGSQLKAALHNIIDGHTTYPYSSSSTDTWDILKDADKDPNNPNNVIGIYSGFSMNGPAEYDNGNGWSREHVWAKSRGDFGTSQGPGTDCHHLRAEDVSTNSARSNRNFDNADYYYVDGSGQYSGSTLSKTSDSEYIWEPRDAVKGDVARMIFYMVVRYEGTNGEPDLELTDTYLSNTSKEPLHSKLSTLIEWHLNDPVDNFEIQRNEVIYGYQNNRNPFIDHPEYVCEIYPTYCTSSPSNNAPAFASAPILSVTEGDTYNYSVIATDADGDPINISASSLPSWLSFIDNGDGTALLNGATSSSEVGIHSITLTASDGTDNTTQTFDITVEAQSVRGNASDLFISEYIEGSSYNKGIELANFTGSDVNLSSYSLMKSTNGSGSWGSEYSLSGDLSSGEVFVIVHSSADAAMQAQADISTGSGIVTFNGNDAIGLFKNGALIDLLGNPNDAVNFAQDITLVRKSTVTGPSSSYQPQEWHQFATNNFNFLGAHSFDGGTATSCDVPTNLSIANITTTTADVSWSGNSSAIGYGLRYRVSGSSTWTNISVSGTSYSLAGLSDNTAYEFEVRSECGSLNSSYSAPETFTTQSAQISYCTSGGQYANEEWIQRVVFNTLDNTSGSNGGYADFTSSSTSVQAGQTYSFSVHPEWSGRSFSEAYDIWIDYNQDGDFADAGEYVATISKTRDVVVSGYITIPTTAKNGSTRMRVSMKYNRNATSCEFFTYGEVEDYTVNISEGFSSRKALILENVKPDPVNNLKVYPNPTSGKLFVDMEVRKRADVNIVSLNGMLVKQATFVNGEAISMNLEGLDNGMYMLILKEEGNKHVTKLVIK
ncbi:endonuclease [Marivirga atlantica]|uniref:Endonuclease n=1 Tax=Marivirga atlantica TaxID=1548457 RepID=A0A937A5G7_9BACT|nr:endonuclease [Marivirga atlantica]MBL0763945.1 endonuclease [Marivirga atlantica]